MKAKLKDIGIWLLSIIIVVVTIGLVAALTSITFPNIKDAWQTTINSYVIYMLIKHTYKELKS